jgi:hypothetical protein
MGSIRPPDDEKSKKSEKVVLPDLTNGSIIVDVGGS